MTIGDIWGSNSQAKPVLRNASVRRVGQIIQLHTILRVAIQEYMVEVNSRAIAALMRRNGYIR